MGDIAFENPEEQVRWTLREQFGLDESVLSNPNALGHYLEAFELGYSEGLKLRSGLGSRDVENNPADFVILQVTALAYQLGVTGQEQETTGNIRGMYAMFGQELPGFREMKNTVRHFENTYEAGQTMREVMARQFGEGALLDTSAWVVSAAMNAGIVHRWGTDPLEGTLVTPEHAEPDA